MYLPSHFRHVAAQNLNYAQGQSRLHYLSIKTKCAHCQSTSTRFCASADLLLKLQISIVKIFSPEHGFRGTVADGVIKNTVDAKSGIPIVSLYGNKKPSGDDLKDIDIKICDIQDVGVRLYTHISTCIMLWLSRK